MQASISHRGRRAAPGPGARGRASSRRATASPGNGSAIPGPGRKTSGSSFEESQLQAADFRGKLVLDAGCGMGRYAKVALAFGAEVTACDLSDALLRLAEEAPLAQAPCRAGRPPRAPFKPKQFDIVYSHGVLHHTSDTRAAFKSVAALVKEGGLLNVWLYGKAGRFAEFSTNPLRSGRGWWQSTAAWPGSSWACAMHSATADGLDDAGEHQLQTASFKLR